MYLAHSKFRVFRLLSLKALLCYCKTRQMTFNIKVSYPFPICHGSVKHLVLFAFPEPSIKIRSSGRAVTNRKAALGCNIFSWNLRSDIERQSELLCLCNVIQLVFIVVRKCGNVVFHPKYNNLVRAAFAENTIVNQCVVCKTI